MTQDAKEFLKRYLEEEEQNASEVASQEVSPEGEKEQQQKKVPQESKESEDEKNNQSTKGSPSVKKICSEITKSFGKQNINGTDLVITPTNYSNPVDNGDGTCTYSVQFSIMKPKDSFGTKAGKALGEIGKALSNFSPYGNTSNTTSQSYTKSVLQ